MSGILEVILLLFGLLICCDYCIKVANPPSNIVIDTSVKDVVDVIVEPSAFYSSNESFIYMSIPEKENWLSSTLSGKLIGKTESYNSVDVVVYQQFAYLSDTDAKIKIFNMDDPGKPSYVGVFEDELTEVSKMYLFGHHLFVIDDPTGFAYNPKILQIIDCSHPTKLKIVGGYPVVKPIFFTLNGDYGIFMTENGLEIANFTNFSSTFRISSTPLSKHYDFAIRDDLMYVSAFHMGLRVFDISNIMKPVAVSQTSCAEAVRLLLDGNFVYVTGKFGLYVFDIINPIKPKKVGECSIGVNCQKLKVVGDLLYALKTGDLYTVDVSSKTHPEILDTYPFGHDTYGFDLKGNLAFISSLDEGIVVLNISNSTDLKLIYRNSKFGNKYGYQAMDLAYMDGYVYMSTYRKGVVIFNVTDREGLELWNLPILSMLPLPTMTMIRIILRKEGGKKYVYLANSLAGISIVEVTDPTTPLHRGSKGFGSRFCQHIAIKDQYAYLTFHQNPLVAVVDISVKTAPSEAATFNLPIQYQYGWDLWVTKDNYLYVSSDRGGIYVYNVKDPTQPKYVGKSANNIIGDIACLDEHDLCYACYSGRMDIYNMTNKTLPVSVFRDTGFGCESPRIKDKMLYSSTAMWDISDPYKPVVLGSLTGIASGKTDFGSGNRAYVTDDKRGMKIVDMGSIKITVNKSRSVSVGNIVCGNHSVIITGKDKDDVRVNTSFTLIFEDLCARSRRGKCFYENLTCNCDQNYYGEVCDGWNCYDVTKQNSFVCQGRGKCVSHNNCSCKGINRGKKCEKWACFGISIENTTAEICGGHGKCVSDDECQCANGYNSLTLNGPCTEFYCGEFFRNASSKVCNKRGKCIQSHVCSCDSGYEGNLCETFKCGNYDFKSENSACNGNGKCTSPNKCSCSWGYEGNECETNMMYYTILAPSVGLGSIFGIIGITVLIILVIITVICLFCCFLIYIFCCCCFCCCGCCCLCCQVLKQQKGIKRFSKLKNFDLLLKEQELEEDDTIGHLKINKDLFCIPFEEIKMIRILGEGGSSSIVYAAKWQKQKVAFKCFRTKSICGDQHTFDEFEREVVVMANLSHPNIIRFFGASLKPPRVGILMEFCSNGEIIEFFGYYQKENNFIKEYPFIEKLRMIEEICSGFVYLHSRSIIHRDLKCENVLIDESEHCKIMDFGLSKIVERMSQVKTKRIGTSFYMAPEIVLSGNYNEKCDVFSFSILCWILITEENNFPYGKHEEQEEEQEGLQANDALEFKIARNEDFRPDINILRKKIQFLEKQNNNCEEEDFNLKDDYEWLIELICSCWKHNFEERPSFEEISVFLGTKKSGTLDKGGKLGERSKKKVLFKKPISNIIPQILEIEKLMKEKKDEIGEDIREEFISEKMKMQSLESKMRILRNKFTGRKKKGGWDRLSLDLRNKKKELEEMKSLLKDFQT